MQIYFIVIFLLDGERTDLKLLASVVYCGSGPINKIINTYYISKKCCPFIYRVSRNTKKIGHAFLEMMMI